MHTDGLRLVLVRHGETIGNSRIRYFGRTDLELSTLGRAQMRAVRRWLEGRFGRPRFHPVFSSPLRRASEGARIIAGEDAPLIEIADFVEVDFGLFEGLTAEEIRTRHPAEFERWDRDRLAPDYVYPQGESRAAFTARVERGIHRMLQSIGPEDSPGCALVVAHRGVIRTIVRWLAGVEPQIELGSIHILQRHGDQDWRTEILDIIEHLPSP